MAEHQITRDEQNCIADCITTHWGNPNRQNNVDDQQRDREYEQCLSDCRICG